VKTASNHDSIIVKEQRARHGDTFAAETFGQSMNNALVAETIEACEMSMNNGSCMEE
jgi:pyrimidine deaminase RibD-like protein